MSGANCDCCGTLLLLICRFLGLATALGLWGVGVEALFYGHHLGFYLVPLAVLISFLEIVFLLNYVMELCLSPTSVCVPIWDAVRWVDNWRKGLLYLLLSVPCFINPQSVPLALASGAMLVLTGLFYALKTIPTKREEDAKKFISNTVYDRFREDGTEDLEESISNPTNNPTVMSVADQVEILEV